MIWRNVEIKGMWNAHLNDVDMHRGFLYFHSKGQKYGHGYYETQRICITQESWIGAMTPCLGVHYFKKCHQNWWSGWRSLFTSLVMKEISATLLASLFLFPSPKHCFRNYLTRSFQSEYQQIRFNVTEKRKPAEGSKTVKWERVTEGSFWDCLY